MFIAFTQSSRPAHVFDSCINIPLNLIYRISESASLSTSEGLILIEQNELEGIGQSHSLAR